jgi:hypothetical protein
VADTRISHGSKFNLIPLYYPGCGETKQDREIEGKAARPETRAIRLKAAAAVAVLARLAAARRGTAAVVSDAIGRRPRPPVFWPFSSFFSSSNHAAGRSWSWRWALPRLAC